LSLTYENTDGKQRKNCIVKKLIASIGCATFPSKWPTLLLLLFYMLWDLQAKWVMRFKNQ